MPVTVVTGAPFSGKGQFVRDEIERREQDGELGLVDVDFTALYSALVPGAQSAFRDEAVSDSGSPRFVGYIYEVAIAQIAQRELSGYVTTNSPRRALQITERLGASLLDVPVSIEQIADRAESHMASLRRGVPRAARAKAVGRCRDAAVSYLREVPALVGRAREVTRRGNQWEVGGTRQAFDRAAFERGLTPGGRAVRDQLVAEGIAEPTPAEILSRLLRDRDLGG